MTGKSSFVLYVDQKELVDDLTDAQAGQLIKAVFSYVNDEHPSPPVDPVVKVVYTVIKLQLKRDLVGWKKTVAERVESGRLGGIKSGEVRRKQKEANEGNASETKQTQANEAVTGTVTVNGTVNVTGTVNEQYKEPAVFLKSKIEIELNAMAAKSGLGPEGFEFCLNQWSLACEKDAWEYSADEQADLRRLQAGFKKWLNTWVENERKRGGSATLTMTNGKSKAERIREIGEDYQKNNR